MARRRGQVKGWLRKCGPSWLGGWREDFIVDGKIKRVKISKTIGRAKGPGAISKRQARRLFTETILDKLDTVSTRPQTMATLAEFIRLKYEPECVAMRKKSGRRAAQSRIANHIIPELGAKRLRDIGPDHVNMFLQSRLRSGLAPLTVGSIKSLLGAIFQHAKRTGYLSGESPAAYVRLPELRARNPRGALSFEQVWLLAAAQEPLERALVLVLTILGLRIGEALGLRWRRLNLSNDIVSYQGEVVPARAALIVENFVVGDYGTLKRTASNRILPLPRLLIEALGAHREAAVWTAPDDPVFADSRGKPARRDKTIQRIRAAAADVELPRGWSWHWLRHSSASLSDQAGMSAVERQKGLGHGSQHMTMHYSHADLERMREGLERVAERMRRGKAGEVVEFKGKG